MITVAERLLESWLDNQTERRYQPAFIQMLVSEGWTVLHNTRHSPIELGKDVIARDPQGSLHCFQLKGNPGSRVTKSEAASLLVQFHELVRLPPGPQFLKDRDEKHVAVFVTNGEIDEEARLLFERAGDACGQPGVAASSYELWSRGKLLSLATPAIRVWPASIEATRLILNILAGDGQEPPVPADISTIMASLLPSDGASSPARTSALSAMLVISEIIKQRWYQQENHQALHAVTVLTCIAALPLADTSERFAMIQGYAPLALEHCSNLLMEAKAKNFEPDRSWSERDMLGEIDVMWERRRLVADCAAVAILGKHDLSVELRDYAVDLITRVTRQVMLWGQAQIPSLVVAFWARSLVDAGVGREFDFAATLRAIESANGGDNERNMLPGPYYSWPDVWALHQNKPHMTESPIFNDTARGHLHFGRAIMGMLAKRNLKRTCGQLWADHTRIIHEEPDLPDGAFFSAVLTDTGSMRDIQLRTGVWAKVVNEAIDGGAAPFLDRFAPLAWLIAAYVSLVPYRAWTRVLLWLDSQLADTWYHEGCRPR
ncbi:hypothetical protein [Sphingomonas azotifigens]|uniref:hypothetical protein n=1 Tax=Sphingomonas azotifigens TaxID=330920 RepID=UPI000A026E04|nr:hypothetical protein [Sphingomonas azotifigens]